MALLLTISMTYTPVKIDILKITKIPTELNICGDHGYNSRNKMPKVPIDSMCAKKVIQGQRSKFSGFFYFSLKR